MLYFYWPNATTLDVKYILGVHFMYVWWTVDVHVYGVFLVGRWCILGG